MFSFPTSFIATPILLSKRNFLLSSAYAPSLPFAQHSLAFELSHICVVLKLSVNTENNPSALKVSSFLPVTNRFCCSNIDVITDSALSSFALNSFCLFLENIPKRSSATAPTIIVATTNSAIEYPAKIFN